MSGAELIAAERERQVTAEGWTPDHDDAYENRELSEAACCYTRWAGRGRETPPPAWPWDPSWWKTGVAVRDLTKAGALIAAEIDRLQRCA